MPGVLTAAIAAIYGASAVITDPYFNYTTLLLPGTGTNGAQNNTFLDSSSNTFTITRNGNTTQGTFSPFSQTGWGNYFDGTTDYLSVASNAAFTLGSSSDFCIEGWIYSTGTPGTDAVIAGTWQNGSSAFANRWLLSLRTSGTAIYWWDSTGSPGITYTGITTNQWIHIAVVRNSGTITLYVNGVSRGTQTTNQAYTTQDSLKIGGGITGTSDFPGYISNLRVVLGAPVYTSAFTPPTTPLTAISGTSLLTCQSNRFRDASTNNFTITRNGDTSVVAFSPFAPSAAWSSTTNGGSGYFDGTGDYLTAPDNAAFQLDAGSFCIEGWFFPTTTGDGALISKWATTAANAAWNIVRISGTLYCQLAYGSSAINATTSDWPLNQWSHIAFVRSANTLSAYLNGVRFFTNASFSNTVNVGVNGVTVGNQSGSLAYPFTGYLSGFRVVKGSSVYDPTQTSITVPTAPLTNITNTSLLLNFTNAGVYDATSKNDLETVGDAQISSTTAKWGSTSIKFDGTGDYLTNNNASNPLLAFGTGDFTIEGWFYSNNALAAAAKGMFQTSDTIGGLKTTYTTGVAMYHGSTGELVVFVGGTAYSTSGASITTGAWFYFAITRSSGNVNVYVNGVSRASGSGNTSNLTGTYICVGGYYNTSYLFDGYLQDFRITKGIARTITASPTAAFPLL